MQPITITAWICRGDNEIELQIVGEVYIGRGLPDDPSSATIESAFAGTVDVIERLTDDEVIAIEQELLDAALKH